MEEPLPLLSDAVVQKVDVAPDLVVMRLRAPGETSYLIFSAKDPRSPLGLVGEKPFKGTGLFGAGGAPLDEKRRWRSRLEGARVLAICERRAVFTREDAVFVVEAPSERGGRVKLRKLGEGEDALAAAEGALYEADRARLVSRGEALSEALGEGAFEARKGALVKALAKALSRVERRMEAVRGDLARIAEASQIAAQAAAFVAAASRAPRGARELRVLDWSTGEERELVLKLDPARPAREQIEAMFKRARRLKQGAAIAGERLSAAEAAWERLAELAEEAKKVEEAGAIEPIARAAREAAPRDFAFGAGGSVKKASGEKAQEKSKPYRVFRALSGARVFVGRGAAHNDALTFRTARPHDLWLHAKDQKGAHVIVPLEKNQVCPSDVLVDAATLAAHFSDARAEAVVDVQYTPRRYLRKPKGSAPGLVVVDREKVMALRLEAERLTRLLEREELG